ncbi:hypothetical protein QP397_24200, partial [Klebsiella aerogenes]|nr:hypothetical protein [Klebsiella aerogenes]
MATPLPTPTQNPVPSTDIRDAVYAGAMMDEVVTSAGAYYVDRFGNKHLTIEGLRAYISPLGKAYTQAQATEAIASGEIADGALFFMFSDEVGVIARLQKNVGGTPVAQTEFIADGTYQLTSSNLIENSRASDSEKLPTLFTGPDSGGKWGAASAEMVAHGAVQSVQCPARSSTSDPAVNYVFQQELWYATGGQYIAASFLFRGDTTLAFWNLQPAA